MKTLDDIDRTIRDVGAAIFVLLATLIITIMTGVVLMLGYL